MKINDIKHNHSLTDLLKVGIFSILMLAPLIAIGSTCAYAIVNKNAYKSYSGETETRETFIHNKNELEEGETYYFKAGALNSGNMIGGYEQYIEFTNVNVINNDTNIDISQYNAIGFYAVDTQVYYYLNVMGTTFDTQTTFSYLDNVEFSFEYISNTLVGDDILVKSDNFFTVTLLPNAYLDNAFYYATEKMTQSDLFNWTENTAIYTGVQAMCTNLEIETNVIPILIVYWFILTIIYVIIDIVLKTFTTLTHMLSKETH